MISRRPATPEDAVWVGMHLRDDDRREVQTVSPGILGVEAATRGFDLSHECFALCDGPSPEPIALFGVVGDPTTVRVGTVWFLATPKILGKGLRIAKAVRPWLDAWCRLYPGGIGNIIDSRNDLHVRWCALSGFTVRPDFMQIDGVPFHHIHRTPEATPLV